MEENVLLILRNHLHKGDTVILALSGGPDSVFLLHYLDKIKGKFPLNIITAHFNHKLRGQESNLDEVFCEKLAKKQGMLFEKASEDINTYAKKEKMSLEEAARTKRYEFLNKIKKKHNASAILTAHHLDDNVETFLLNFIRGASIDGLKAIKPYNNGVLRPLLNIEKQRILTYLKNNKIKFQVDKSNEDKSFTRNKIRHLITPIFNEINPNFHETFLNNIGNIQQIHNYIEKEAEKWIKKNKNSNISFAVQPEFLRKQILKKIFFKYHKTDKQIDSKLLERADNLILEGNPGKKIPFGKNTFLKLNNIQFKIIKSEKTKKIKEKELKIDGITNFLDKKIKSRTHKSLNNTDFKEKGHIYLNKEKIKSPLYVRSWKKGDKFTPFGMKNSKKIQDFFTDIKIDKEDRNKIPIIVDKKGNILSVSSLRINNDYRVSSSTKEVLELTLT